MTCFDRWLDQMTGSVAATKRCPTCLDDGYIGNCNGKGPPIVWQECPDCGNAKNRTCPTCEGGGWECYGIGIGDPHFRECLTCHNPEGHPQP